jgi:hypothetical protein
MTEIKSRSSAVKGMIAAAVIKVLERSPGVETFQQYPNCLVIPNNFEEEVNPVPEIVAELGDSLKSFGNTWELVNLALTEWLDSSAWHQCRAGNNYPYRDNSEVIHKSLLPLDELRAHGLANGYPEAIETVDHDRRCVAAAFINFLEKSDVVYCCEPETKIKLVLYNDSNFYRVIHIVTDNVKETLIGSRDPQSLVATIFDYWRGYAIWRRPDTFGYEVAPSWLACERFEAALQALEYQQERCENAIKDENKRDIDFDAFTKEAQQIIQCRIAEALFAVFDSWQVLPDELSKIGKAVNVLNDKEIAFDSAFDLALLSRYVIVKLNGNLSEFDDVNTLVKIVFERWQRLAWIYLMGRICSRIIVVYDLLLLPFDEVRAARDKYASKFK